MAAKPIVDGIEREHSGRLKVIRLNVQEPHSQSLMERFDFQFTPTFILLNGDGKEIWRLIGSIDPQKVRQSLADLP
jgi:thioredoxin-related protein